MPARGAPRPSLRPGRRYFYLALRTGLWTAAALSCAAYLSFEKLSPPARAAAPEAAPAPAARETRLAAPPPEAPAPAAPAQDSVALVKGYRSTAKKAAPAGTAKPRLVTPEGSRGGWFAQNVFPSERDGGATAPEAPRPDPDAPVLSGKALKAGLKVKGARPVPKAVARRYAGQDPEGESARQGRLIRETAEAAELERLARKRLLRYSAVFFLIAAFSTAASRVLQAWRGIHKPDGPHWTLR